MKAYVDENKKRGKYKCVERERVQKRGGKKVISKRKRTIVKKYTRKKYPEEGGHDEKKAKHTSTESHELETYLGILYATLSLAISPRRIPLLS